MEHNEEMRVIAVGDDDQNIFDFRGASSKYLEQFTRENKAAKHELVENFRSKSNLVDFTNQFVKQNQSQVKKHSYYCQANRLRKNKTGSLSKRKSHCSVCAGYTRNRTCRHRWCTHQDQ